MNNYQNQQLNQEVQKMMMGDFSSYTNLYNLSAQYIYNTIFSIVNDQNTANTIIQETYQEIYQTINRLSDPQAFLPWANQIAYKRALAYIQTQDELETNVLTSAPMQAPPASNMQNPASMQNTPINNAQKSGMGNHTSKEAASKKMSPGLKIGIIVGSVVILVLIIVGILLLVKNKKNKKEQTTATTTEEITTTEIATITDATTEEITTEEVTTEEVTTEESVSKQEIYKSYVKEVLIPQKGLCQNGQITLPTSSFGEAQSVMKESLTGIIAVDIEDFDNDGEDEMLVISGEQVDLGYDNQTRVAHRLQLFGLNNQEVVSLDDRFLQYKLINNDGWNYVTELSIDVMTTDYLQAVVKQGNNGKYLVISHYEEDTMGSSNTTLIYDLSTKKIDLRTEITKRYGDFAGGAGVTGLSFQGESESTIESSLSYEEEKRNQLAQYGIQADFYNAHDISYDNDCFLNVPDNENCYELIVDAFSVSWPNVEVKDYTDFRSW